MQINLLLILIELLLFIFLQRGILGKGISIIKVFNFAWLGAYTVLITDYYHFYTIDDRVCFYSGLYILFVNISFVFVRKRKGQVSLCTDAINSEMFHSRKTTKVLFVLSVLCWLFSVNRIVKSLAIIMFSGMVDLRGEVYAGEVYSTIEMLSYQYFVQPLFMITVIMAVQSLVLEKKKDLLLIFAAIINAIVYSILFAGRAPLAWFCIFSFLLLIIKNGGNLTLVYKRQKKILFVFLIFFIPIYLYASLRVTREWGLFSEVGLYMTGGFPYLSEMIKANEIDYGVGGGKLMFGALYDIYGLGVRFLHYSPELASQLYSDYASEFRYVSPELKTNFTATALLSLLLDFGLWGVILGGILYGVLFGIVEIIFTKKVNLFSLALYMYFANIAVESLQGYTFKSTVVIFTILYMWLFLGNALNRKKYINEYRI